MFLFVSLFFTLLPVCSTYAQYSKQDTIRFRNYYNKCKEVNLRENVILKMADTLISYAESYNYKKGVTLALFLKMNHYINLRNTDSIIFYDNKIKAHTLTTGEKNHYFLAWRNLASYYIDEGHYLLALKEIEKMPQKAKEMNYIQGVIESHRMLSALHYARNLYDKSIESMEIAIAMNEEYKKNDFNLYYKYYLLTLSYIEIGKFDKAKESLDAGLKNAKTNHMRGDIYRGYLRLYIEKGDKIKAKEYLDTVSLPKYKPAEHISDILSLEAQYYTLTKEYDKALSKYEELDKYIASDLKHLKRKAYSLQQAGKFWESNETLWKAIKMQDSLQIIDAENDIYGQLALIEMNSVEVEKDRIAGKLRDARLKYTTIGIIILSLVLALFVFLTFKFIKINRLLKKSEIVKTTFLNNLSHEIRTPMNSIVGFSQLLSDENLSKEDFSNCISVIRESSEELLKMITAATDVNEIDYFGKEEDVNINLMCEHIIEQYSKEKREGVTIDFSSDLKQQQVFFVNAQKIIKVLSALLDNAVHFTEEGKIKITVRTNENKLVFTISDTGPGIPEEKQEVIFDLFSKLDEYKSGLGLGLSVARLMTNSMKGSLEIDKTYTDGCRFIFMVPVN